MLAICKNLDKSQRRVEETKQDKRIHNNISIFYVECKGRQKENPHSCLGMHSVVVILLRKRKEIITKR